jgi:pimeloyl-ACP methyl ester carboxylesterase
LSANLFAQRFGVGFRPNLSEHSRKASKLNFELPTLGGSQYWSDVRVVGEWKIQRNAATEHHRLIDDKDIRRAWGTREQCEFVLQAEMDDQRVKPVSGRVVILLHGLLRSSDSMDHLSKYLQDQGGYQVINFAYASSAASIEVHAADLKSVIDGLGPEVTEINFVAHSMGNIVVRHYLKSLEQAREKPPAPFGRMVMLAPPNQGSHRAKNLATATRMFEKVAGPSGLQLGVEWDELAPQLATPSFEFGIIIGAKEESEEAEDDDDFDFQDMLAKFKNSGLKPHDFTVSVDEAKLDGAKDFMVGPFFHWDIKYRPQAMRQTLVFLEFGRFEDEVPETAENPRGRKLRQR